MRSLTRRATIASAIAASVAAAATARAQEAKPADAKAPGLNAHARTKGMFYGSAVSSGALSNDSDLLDHVVSECGMLVSEDAFKWDALHYDPKKFDFARADALMGFGLMHQIPVRGHTLVWHESTPDWVEPLLTNKTVSEKILTDHIKAVAGRYAGRLVHWDVVNEVIQGDDKKPQALRDTMWYRALGPAYLDIAFHTTQVADPHALRVINEYGVEYGLDWQIRKRHQLLDLCADLLHRKVPLQAVGLQAHLDAGELNLDQTAMSKFVADIASMGLKVIITEFDVRDQRLPATLPARDNAIAAHARAWLDSVLPNPAVLGMLSWGLSDRSSWVNTNFPRADGLPQRPLPLDAELNRKKLWSSVAGALDSASPRVAKI